ncbi:MAG TPA: hypothetical protein VFZ04_19945, partial [Longimicrobiales bacterium]
MKLFACLLLMSVPAAAQQAPVPDPALAALYFAEAHALAARDAGRLWGRPLASPMIFADPRTRAAVASVADAEGRLSRQG